MNVSTRPRKDVPNTEAEKVTREETQARRTSLEASENYAEVKTRIWTVACPGEQHTSCRPEAGFRPTSRRSHQTTGVGGGGDTRACCLPDKKPQSLHHKEPHPKIQKTPEQGPCLSSNIPGPGDTLEPLPTHAGREDAHVCAQLRWRLLQLPGGF